MPDNLLEIKENVPLAPLTTLGVGGAARFFVRATSEDHVAAGVKYARENGLQIFVLGGGSNILVSDKGFDGLVISVELSGVEIVNDSESNVELNVGAGEDWDAFVDFCVRSGYHGVECLSGIPGLVGGTPIQNVGAYGQEVSSTIDSLRAYDRQTDQIVELSNGDCGFAYRTSIFNTIFRNRYIVLSVRFTLSKAGRPTITYRDLKEYFSGREPTLDEVRNSVLSIRRTKSMVIDERDPNSRSAGSFFKNPIVDRAVYERIAAEFADAPYFEVDAFHVKIPAAWLIERAGFAKGTVLGNAGISANHTLAIINRGNASATDIINLKNAVEAGVRAKFGIDLSPEPIFVGFNDANAKN